MIFDYFISYHHNLVKEKEELPRKECWISILLAIKISWKNLVDSFDIKLILLFWQWSRHCRNILIHFS